MSQNYLVNLMWLNQDLKEGCEYIYCGNNIQKGFLEPILGWAEKTAGDCEIRVWYNSKTTTPEAVKRTEELIQNMLAQSNKNSLSKVSLVDIHTLKSVQEYEAILFPSVEQYYRKPPVYFKADLIRVMICHEIAEKKEHNYIVYSDLNIPPLTSGELFNDSTKRDLEVCGLVLAKNAKNDTPYENAFYIIDSNNIDMMQAIKIGLIDINLKRAEIFSQESILENQLKNYQFMEQIVYMSHDAMMKLYKFYKGEAEIGKNSYKNIPSHEERLHFYDESETIIEIKRALLKENFVFDGIVYKPEENLNRFFKIKAVNKPVSSFYNTSRKIFNACNQGANNALRMAGYNPYAAACKMITKTHYNIEAFDSLVDNFSLDINKIEKSTFYDVLHSPKVHSFLHIAIENIDADLVTHLLKKGADIFSRPYGISPLEFLCGKMVEEAKKPSHNQHTYEKYSNMMRSMEKAIIHDLTLKKKFSDTREQFRQSLYSSSESPLKKWTPR